MANIAYHNRLRARQMGGGGEGWSEGNNLDDIRLFVSPSKIIWSRQYFNPLFTILKEFKSICITERA